MKKVLYRIPNKHYLSYVLMLCHWLAVIPWFRTFVFRTALIHCTGCGFEPGFRFFYGHHIKATGVGLSNVLLMDYDNITIGEGSGFSKDCMVITAQHDVDNFKRIVTMPVKIGKNVYMAARSVILPGVTIGDDVVIGAGSVVTHDIPSRCFAAGNPAKIIRTLS